MRGQSAVVEIRYSAKNECRISVASLVVLWPCKGCLFFWQDGCQNGKDQISTVMGGMVECSRSGSICSSDKGTRGAGWEQCTMNQGWSTECANIDRCSCKGDGVTDDGPQPIKSPQSHVGYFFRPIQEKSGDISFGRPPCLSR